VTDIARNRPPSGRAAESRWLPSSQGIVTAATLIFCGGLVAYPLVYLVAESLNISGEDVFPPAEIGVANYTDLIDDWHVLANTAFVACLATAMAIVIGFLAAWTLTRTKLPGRPQLERLMELPYYMTPLVGALAWSILAAPRTGFINQLWHGIGGGGDAVRSASPGSWRCSRAPSPS
jgi:iron(III) transport system permease protein